MEKNVPFTSGHIFHPHHAGPFPDKGQPRTAALVLEHWLKGQEAGRFLHKLCMKKTRNRGHPWWAMLGISLDDLQRSLPAPTTL